MIWMENENDFNFLPIEQNEAILNSILQPVLNGLRIENVILVEDRKGRNTKQ